MSNTMHRRRDGWVFTDCYETEWLLHPTGDTDMPLTMSPLERGRDAADHADDEAEARVDDEQERQAFGDELGVEPWNQEREPDAD